MFAHIVAYYAHHAMALIEQRKGNTYFAPLIDAAMHYERLMQDLKSPTAPR